MLDSEIRLARRCACFVPITLGGGILQPPSSSLVWTPRLGGFWR